MTISGTGRSIYETRGMKMTVSDGVGVNLGPEVIAATLTYGPVGACQGGQLKLNALPANWAANTRSHLIRTAIDGEQIHLGIADMPIKRGSELAQVDLLAPHRVYVEVPGQSIFYEGITGGAKAFGVPLPTLVAHKPLRVTLDEMLEPYPNSEFGVAADHIVVMGVPNAGTTPANIVIDSRTEVETLGHVIPPYITHAIFDLGDEWERYKYVRPGVPLYVLRQTGAVVANPQTIRTTESPFWGRLLAVNGGPRFFKETVFPDDISREYSGPPQQIVTSPPLEYGRYQYTLPPDSLSSKNRKLTISAAYVLNDLQIIDSAFGHSAPLMTIRLTHPSGTVGTATTELQYGLIGQEMSANFEVSADLLKGGGQFILEYVLDVYSSNQRAFLTVHPFKAVIEKEVPNFAGVTMPPGWDAPFSVGPRYSVKLRGVHIPPLIVSGLPGGVTQYAAGATVTWTRTDAHTVIETAALPYPGQQRGSL